MGLSLNIYIIWAENACMFFYQMVFALFCRHKVFSTIPTNVSPTLACHMSASSIFLNSILTLGALSYSHFSHKLICHIETIFPLFASVILMGLFTLQTIKLTTQSAIDWIFILKTLLFKDLLAIRAETPGIFVEMQIDKFGDFYIKDLL